MDIRVKVEIDDLKVGAWRKLQIGVEDMQGPRHERGNMFWNTVLAPALISMGKEMLMEIGREFIKEQDAKEVARNDDARK